jgi:hypothetical protein
MKFFKIVSYIFLVLFLIIILLVSYLKFYLPRIEIKELTVELTEERIDRGKYLANHVMLCVDCHSTREWNKYSGPMVPGTEGKGGELFDQNLGLPGKYYVTNITPYELGDWTDGELFRAITAGVGKRNNALFPIMPYHIYGNLDPEDIYAVIAYIRTLPEIKNDVPESESDFPINFLINTFPHEGTPVKRPEKANTLEYGKYITNACGCIDCHTAADDMGQLIMEFAYAGGREFPMPNGEKVLSTNITPDKGTGIGNWNEEKFIRTFKTYDLANYEPVLVKAGEFNTSMPWTMYAGLDSLDLKAMYTYLFSLDPIEK